MIEFDVLALADGTLVLAHSDDLFELTHGKARGRVGTSALAELRELAPELPTLDEALAYLSGTDVGLHVDVKWVGYERRSSTRSAGTASLPARSSARSSRPASSRWAPPSPACGARSRTRSTATACRSGSRSRPRCSRPSSPCARRCRVGSAACSTAPGRRSRRCTYLVATRSVIERCHDHGAAVWAWTVDEPRTVTRLAAGVDGIVSNDPRVLAATLTT